MSYIESNRKLNSLAAKLTVSTSRAESIIRETNKYLHRQFPYLVIEDAVAALPMSYQRQPIFLAAQILKTAHLTSKRIPQPEAILAETEAAANLRFYMTLVRGASYYQEAVKKISSEDTVILKREPDNPYDPNAIMVCTESGELTGYVDRYLAKRVVSQVDEMGGTIQGTVLKKFANCFPKNTLGVMIYFALPKLADKPRNEGNP